MVPLLSRVAAAATSKAPTSSAPAIPDGSFASSSIPSSSPDFSGSHITDGKSIPREKIGPASAHLEKQMQALYWQGVKRELSGIILTLRAWQLRSEMAETVLADEQPGEGYGNSIHGYETFMDQVSQSARDFAARNSPPDVDESIETDENPLNEMANKYKSGPTTYLEALRLQGLDYYTQLRSKHLKEAVRESISSVQSLDVQKRRARMLLQAAQFLDIDKLIEYREPEKLLSFWKRPAPPQLTVSSFDERDMPIFEPQRCSNCTRVIRGSTYQNVRDEATIVCETCYRRFYNGKSSFAKNYKSCCLREAMTTDASQKICLCPNAPHRDANGKRQGLWPLTEEKKGEDHYHGGPGRVGCGIYELNNMVAEAKYVATRGKGEWEPPTLEEVAQADLEYYRKLKRIIYKHSMTYIKKQAGDEFKPQGRPRKLPNLNNKAAISEFGASYGQTDIKENVPRYLRSVTDDYPFGNVHMAVRFGPICIENGVANTHGGALITSRNPPELQVLRDPPKDIEHSLLLTGLEERTVYSQNRPRASKRYKAIVKQVVGGAFCGLFDYAAELDIINALIEESKALPTEGLRASEKALHLERASDRLLARIQPYLAPRVDIFLQSISARLLDPKLPLRWNFRTNNCQTFCDNLIDRDYFGAMFAPSNDVVTPEMPLYLMSFVCRPQAYVPERVRTKYDVANGMMEEYLLKFKHGRHDESDIIDTLQEYWYDWGNFEGPIYPYQDVFPWDCTEAYCRNQVKCSECNISKHVWAFPFDSWSIISLHLARGRQFYPRSGAIIKTADGEITRREDATGTAQKTGLMTDLDWFFNRLNILLAQDALLSGATAMAQCAMFRKSTNWIHKQAVQSRDRLKLGGIHRAQPFSHHFERGAYHQFYVAEWASLALPLRIRAYEHIRDWRATLRDVVDTRRGDEDSDNEQSGGTTSGGGTSACSAVACSAVACGTGCAGGDTGGVGDTCGTGCASCGGGGGGGCGGGGGGGGGGGCGGGGGGGGCG